MPHDEMRPLGVLRQEAPGVSFIDHNHIFGARLVGFIELATLPQLHAHDAEIFRRDDPVLGGRLRLRPPGDLNPQIEPRPERQVAGHRGRFHARQAFDSFESTAEEVRVLSGCVVLRPVGCDLRSKHVARVKSRIHLAQIGEGAHQQGRPSEQHQRQCDFSYDEHATQSAAAGQPPAGALFEPEIDINSRRLKRRGQSKDQSCRDGGDECEGQH